MMFGMRMGGRGTRAHVGLIYLTLSICGIGGALFLSHYFNLGAAATAITLLPSVPGLYLAWATFRAAQVEADGAQDLITFADALARAVGAQWRDEARLRRLNDPYALAVSWNPAPDDLVEAWPLLVSVAQEWPEGSQTDPAEWAQESANLAGSWSQILDVLTKSVPTRRLVVLGKPGAGKTMLVVQLAQGLIARRAKSVELPVPVIFSLASWNPFDQGLFDWMTACLVRDYQGLDQMVSVSGRRGFVGRALLDQGMILPILDGLDELPTDSRPVALDAINGALVPGQGIVISSRTAEYRKATTTSGGVTVKLAGAAGIELQPLGAQAVATYLHRDGGDGAAAAKRWELVARQLGTATPVGRALRTPLMLFLARTIYNPRPGTYIGGALPDPADLCDPERFPDQAAVERHLLSQFIPAAYRPTAPGAALPFAADQALQTLALLARHLEHDLQGTPDLAWWRLSLFLPRNPTALLAWVVVATAISTSIGAVGALPAGIAYALASRISQGSWMYLPAGAVAGIIGLTAAGLAFGMSSGLSLYLQSFFSRRSRFVPWETRPSSKIRWSPAATRFPAGVALGILSGVVSFAAFGDGIGLFIGAPIGISIVILSGLRPALADVTRAADPASLLVRDRRSFLQIILAGVAAGAVSTAVLFAVWARMSRLTDGALDGAIGGSLVGLSLSITYIQLDAIYYSSWLPFTVTRWYLAIQCEFPRNLMGFLLDAHERRGVLRQVGGVYQFRHLDLQRYLAEAPTASDPSPSIR